MDELADVLSGIGCATLHSLWIGALAWAVLFVVLRCTSSVSAQNRYRVGWYVLILLTLSTAVVGWKSEAIQTFFLETVSNALVAANDNFSTENHWLGVEYKQSAEHFTVFDGLVRTFSLASYPVGLVWALGLLVVFVKMVWAWWRLRRLTAGAKPLDAGVIEGWNLQSALNGPGRKVELRVSTGVQSPFVFGFFRPIIFVPRSLLLTGEDRQVKSVLFHEMAHVQRADPITNLFLVVIEACFLLNPFANGIISLLREERECCCDQIAARHLGDRFAYARALVDLQASFQSQDERFALGLGEHALSRRIERLCTGRRPSFIGFTKSGSLLSALILSACACSGYVAVVGNLDRSLFQEPDLNQIRSSLIADYDLDGNATDLSGNHLHGEVRGCTPIPYRHGRPNGALFLDGKTNFVKIPHCSEIQNYASFTATSWIRTDEGDHKWMSWLAKSNLNNKRSQWRIGFGAKTGEWGFTQFTHAERGLDGKASFALWSSDCEIGAAWTHMTAVVNSEEGWVKLYVNGKLSGKIDHVKPFIVDDSPLYIGYQRDEKSYFNGSIDDVKIYGRPLSDAEVLAVYDDEQSH